MTQKRLSTASAMYDQGNKGYLNKSEKLMRELDADGDGILSRVELEAAAKKIMSAKKTAGQWRLITSMLVVALGVAFGMNLFSNEISKDVKPNADGELLTFNYGTGAGKMVTTQQAEAFTSLLDLPRLSITSLQEVKVLTIVLESGEEWLIRVASISKLECGNSIVIYGQNGDEIHINGASGAAYAMVRDNERHVITAGAFHKRRLAAGNSQVAYSREEFFSNNMGFNNGRRLSKAEGGQQGWASLSQSKNTVVTESPKCPVDYNNSGVIGVGSSDSAVFQFTQIGETRVMVSTHGKSGSVYTEGMMYRFDNGHLNRCLEFDLWNDQTDLMNGNPGRDDWKFDTEATFEYSASKRTMEFHIPTADECEVANEEHKNAYEKKIENLDFTKKELTAEDKKRNLANAKAHKAQFAEIYAEATEKWLNEEHNEDTRRMLGGRKLCDPFSGNGCGPPPSNPNWNFGRLNNETIFGSLDVFTHYDNPATGAQYRQPHPCIGVWRGSDEGVDWQLNIMGSWDDTMHAGQYVHGGFVTQFMDTEAGHLRTHRGAGVNCIKYIESGSSLGGGLSEVAAQYYGAPSTTACKQWIIDSDGDHEIDDSSWINVQCLGKSIKLFTTGCPRVFKVEQSSYGTTAIIGGIAALGGSRRVFHRWDFVPTISPWYYHRTVSIDIRSTDRTLPNNSCRTNMRLSSGYCKNGGCKATGIDLGWISADVFPSVNLQEAARSAGYRWCSWRTRRSWLRNYCQVRFPICFHTDGCYRAGCWNWCYKEYNCLGSLPTITPRSSNAYEASGRQDNGPFDFPHDVCERGPFTYGGTYAAIQVALFLNPAAAPFGNRTCLLAMAAAAYSSVLMRNFAPTDHQALPGYIPFYNAGWFEDDYEPFGINVVPH